MTMPNIPKAITSILGQRILLSDHEHVYNTSWKALIAISFKDNELEESPRDLDWKTSIFTAYANILKDKVIKCFHSHSQHEAAILFELVGKSRQAKCDVVTKLCRDDILHWERLNKVVAPAQSYHYPTERIEDIRLIVQVMEEQCCDVNVSLLIEHFWVKNTVCSNDPHQFVFICLNHDSWHRRTHFETLTSLVMLNLLIKVCVWILD